MFKLTQQYKSTRGILWKLSVDAVIGALLFCVVFGVAIGLSEVISFVNANFINSSEIVFAAKGIKFLMLAVDTLLLAVYYSLVCKEALVEMLEKWRSLSES